MLTGVRERTGLSFSFNKMKKIAGMLLGLLVMVESWLLSSIEDFYQTTTIPFFHSGGL